MAEIVFCEWCGNTFIESDRVKNTCKYCGGLKSEPKQPNREFKSFYKDWVVYRYEDMSSENIFYRAGRSGIRQTGRSNFRPAL